MGRKQLNTAEAVEVTLNAGELAKASKAATELVLHDEAVQQRVSDLATQLSYAGALTVGALEDGIRFYQRRTVEACLELGTRLLLLKELTPHGEFLQRTEGLEISPRMSQKLMSATLKFSNANSSSLLEAAGTQTKLLELLVLDDDQIAALQNGESVSGLTLEKIDTMSVRELKAALREANETAEARQKLLKASNAERDALKEKALRPFKPKNGSAGRTEEDQAALNELVEATNAIDVHFERLGGVVADLAAHDRAAMRERALQAVQYLVTRMREVVVGNGLDVRADDETLCGRPAWLDGSEPA